LPFRASGKTPETPSTAGAPAGQTLPGPLAAGGPAAALRAAIAGPSSTLVVGFGATRVIGRPPGDRLVLHFLTVLQCRVLHIAGLLHSGATRMHSYFSHPHRWRPVMTPSKDRPAGPARDVDRALPDRYPLRSQRHRGRPRRRSPLHGAAAEPRAAAECSGRFPPGHVGASRARRRAGHLRAAVAPRARVAVPHRCLHVRRQTPDGDQLDLVEVIELDGPLIAYHRIYWGWRGVEHVITNAVDKAVR